MSRLKNKDNFEQKLREQFENFEATPNEALWKNIDQNLPQDLFEQKVAGKLSDLKFEPSKLVWKRIEKNLPVINKISKRLVYLWTITVLSIGVFIGYFLFRGFSNQENTDNTLIHPKAFVWLMDSCEVANENVFLTETQKAIKNKKSKSRFHENNQIHENTRMRMVERVKNLVRKPSQISNETALASVFVGNYENSNTIGYINSKLLKQQSLAENMNSPIFTDTLILVKTSPSNTPDSAESTKQNKTNTNNLVSESNYLGPSLKKEKLTITAYAGLGSSFMHYQSSTDEQKMYVSVREGTEKVVWSVTGGFLFGYDVSKRVTISSGIVLANFKQTMNYDLTPAKEINLSTEPHLILPTDSVISGSGNVSELNYSFTEIPIFVTYKLLETQKFEIALQSGIGVGFLTGVNTYIIGNKNVGVYEINNKNDYPTFKNTLFFSFQPQFCYNTNAPGVSIGLMPIFKSSFVNIVNDENWIKQYPYNLSFNIFIRKRF
jgi:hypothetical protein